MSPSPTPSDDPASAVNARVEANVRLLEARRISLQAQLLSLRAQHPTIPAAPQPGPSVASFSSTIPDTPPLDTPHPQLSQDDQILENALSSCAVLRTHNLTNLYRMAGITTFTVKEPIKNTPLLGIRFDAFDKRTKGFTKPVYVIIGNTPGGWLVQRHSAPAHIGVAGLEKVHLPAGKGAGEQKVEAFAKAVHRRLRLWRNRESAARWVKEKAMEAEAMGMDEEGQWRRRVKEVEYDGEVRSLEIRWRNGVKVIAKVDEVGKIDGAVALDRKGARDVRLQREMRGSLDELPERLGWM